MGITTSDPQFFLAAQALAHGHRVQLILNARAPLHQPHAMDEQLPQIALAQRRHPDARKGILLIRHQPKNMLRIPLVVLLLAHRPGANRGGIADPQFVPQFLQQPLEPCV